VSFTDPTGLEPLPSYTDRALSKKNPPEGFRYPDIYRNAIAAEIIELSIAKVELGVEIAKNQTDLTHAQDFCDEADKAASLLASIAQIACDASRGDINPQGIGEAIGDGYNLLSDLADVYYGVESAKSAVASSESLLDSITDIMDDLDDFIGEQENLDLAYQEYYDYEYIYNE
jgi:hypothetical protein